MLPAVFVKGFNFTPSGPPDPVFCALVFFGLLGGLAWFVFHPPRR